MGNNGNSERLYFGGSKITADGDCSHESKRHLLLGRKVMTNLAAAAAKSLQSCPTLCDPKDGSPPGSPVPGILQARTLEWVAIPSPMHESEKWKSSHSVVSDSQRPHWLQPTRLLCPWDFPGRSTGLGCHFLLQCRKMKSESEVTQLRPTLGNPMACSLPGSSVHGIFQARVLEWGAISFSSYVSFKNKELQYLCPFTSC